MLGLEGGRGKREAEARGALGRRAEARGSGEGEAGGGEAGEEAARVPAWVPAWVEVTTGRGEEDEQGMARAGGGSGGEVGVLEEGKGPGGGAGRGEEERGEDMGGFWAWAGCVGRWRAVLTSCWWPVGG